MQCLCEMGSLCVTQNDFLTKVFSYTGIQQIKNLQHFE